MDVLVDLARGHVAALDVDLPVLYARPLKDRVQASFVFFDFASVMLLTFGVAGIALAAMGTYGLVSYTVKQSTHEIGIRMALGASGAAVVRGFLGRGLRLGAIGAVDRRRAGAGPQPAPAECAVRRERHRRWCRSPGR